MEVEAPPAVEAATEPNLLTPAVVPQEETRIPSASSSKTPKPEEEKVTMKEKPPVAKKLEAKQEVKSMSGRERAPSNGRATYIFSLILVLKKQPDLKDPLNQ